MYINKKSILLVFLLLTGCSNQPLKKAHSTDIVINEIVTRCSDTFSDEKAFNKCKSTINIQQLISEKDGTVWK